MSLSRQQTAELLSSQVRAYRAVHQPHRQPRRGRVVCCFCVSTWPCEYELWVRAVLRDEK